MPKYYIDSILFKKKKFLSWHLVLKSRIFITYAVKIIGIDMINLVIKNYKRLMISDYVINIYVVEAIEDTQKHIYTYV